LRTRYRLRVLLGNGSNRICWTPISNFGFGRGRRSSRSFKINVGDAAGPDSRVSAVGLDNGEREEENIEHHN
jgi:hypothetical protein